MARPYGLVPTTSDHLFDREEIVVPEGKLLTRIIKVEVSDAHQEAEDLRCLRGRTKLEVIIGTLLIGPSGRALIKGAIRLR